MNRIFGEWVTGRAAVGLLIVRLVFGSALMLHGMQKLSTPTSWMGPDAPVPGALQFLAFLSEFGGGLALVLGLLTPLAALGVFFTMLTAIFMAHLSQGHPFVGAPGKPSFESAAGYLAISLLMLITGPGALSLDALLFGKRRRVSVENPVQNSRAVQPHGSS